VALNPATPLAMIEEVAHLVDVLLIMSVNPGYGGQQFIEYSVNKIARARRLLDQVGSGAVLEVDGGVSRETIHRCWAAGADTFVAGNAIFGAPNPQAEIAILRNLCVEHV
jgi:ribulose-phosphate 3-epimerase